MAQLTRAEITAASLEIQFGGETYRMAPLRDIDFGDMERWLQDKYLSLAKRNLDGLGDGVSSKLINHAFDRACELTVYSPDAQRLLSTIEGTCRLIWLGIRRNHPDVSLDDVMQMATDEDGVVDALNKFERLNSLGQFAKKKQPAQPRQKAKRATKKAERKRKGK